MVAVGLRSVARRVAALVAHGLWITTDGGYRVRTWAKWNTPVTSEDEFIAAQSQHGARGNHERWHVGRDVTDPQCSYCTDPNRVGESGTRSAGRIANKGREGKGREEQLPSSADAEAAFADFYSSYPRKVGRKAAHDAFLRALRRTDAATILDACRRYAADPNQPDDRSKIPHPTTWLNQDRWDDEPLPPRNVHHLPTGAVAARVDPWDR